MHYLDWVSEYVFDLVRGEMSDHAVMQLDPADLFDGVLIKMKEIHAKKKADYSSPEDRFSNFREAAEEAGVTVEQVFAVLIGIKNARIRQLEQPGRDVQNESLLDTYLDKAVYSVLAFAWKMLKNSYPTHVINQKTGSVKSVTELPFYPIEDRSKGGY